jgi:hypothetical protein
LRTARVYQMRRTLGAGGFGAEGIVAGTPWDKSPDQAAGTAHRINGRTDIYSPGVVLYETLQITLCRLGHCNRRRSYGLIRLAVSLSDGVAVLL